MIECNLKRMYESLQRDTKIKFELMSCDYVDGRKIPEAVFNVISIDMSAKMSVELLKKMNKGDIKLILVGNIHVYGDGILEYIRNK